ncbi:MAG TPA: inositol monophosphatase family protein [Acidimicrobiales bacterium]|jgi:myo-inositol-1(or 4)-monophosphatase
MSALPGPSPDPGTLVSLARRAAERAGDLLLDGVHRRRTLVETKSTGTDMVSEMDRASEALIVETLLADRPDDGIVGEEGSERAGTTGVRWVIDPLDGTTNYLYAHPGWAVSIAAEIDDGSAGDTDDRPNGDAGERRVVAGVVLDPVHGDVFTATAGGGAFRNDRPIACSDQRDLALSLVATGFGYRPERRAHQAQVVAGLIAQVRDIRRMGAAAVDLCSVACGRVDAYYERGLAWWDLAAGSLIAAEAGAVVTALDGGPLTAGSVLAAAPGIATSLRDRLSALGAGSGP